MSFSTSSGTRSRSGSSALGLDASAVASTAIAAIWVVNVLVAGTAHSRPAMVTSARSAAGVPLEQAATVDGGVVRRAASNQEDLLTVLGQLRYLFPQGTQRRQSCRNRGRLLSDLLSHDRLHLSLQSCCPGCDRAWGAPMPAGARSVLDGALDHAADEVTLQDEIHDHHRKGHEHCRCRSEE